MKFYFAAAATFVTLLFTSVANADHDLTNIYGPGIELKSFDHGFAGSIRDYIAYGQMDESTFTSRIVVRKDNQTIEAEFAKTGEFIGGSISRMIGDTLTTTKIEFVRIDKENSIFVFKINEKEISVTVTADRFENNHFVNPTYSTVVNDEVVEFTIEDGKACYGYSLHLIMMVVGAYSL